MAVSSSPAARVVAVSRAMPTHVDIRGKRVFTSIVRERSATPLVLGESGPLGNQTAVHTEHLLAFPVEHYAYWTERFGLARDAWPYAFWGENLVLEGVMEEALAIGTVLRIGTSAVLQVTSPRNPCFKLSWRIGQPDAVLQDILGSGRVGFYLRVIEPGPVFDGDAVRAFPPAKAAATVADVARLMAGSVEATPERVHQVLACEGLGVQCAGMLRQRLTDRLDNDRTQTHRWQGWRPFTVAAVAEVAQNIKSFELEAADGGPLAGYRAGQHVQVRFADGAGRGITRVWSLSSYEDRPNRYRLSIRKSGRGAASAFMHDGVEVGSTVELKAPAGSFHIDRSSNHPTVLISAGIGMTPLLAMLKAYAGLGPEAPPLQWIHVARNGQQYAHRDEVEDLLRERPNLRRHVRFTQPLPSDRPGIDYDAQGRLTLDQLRSVIEVYRYPIFGREVELPGAAAEFYVCGPAAFEQDVRVMLAELGVAPHAIRSESFGVGGSDGGQPARVHFARSGVSIEWSPGSTLLEAAEEAGIAAEHDCRSGTCHLCAVKVLDGEIVYPRAPGALPPPGMALVCCSRPASRELVLDL